MKVTLSVIGRFHIFNLAQQLLKRDALARLITSYPKFEVVKYGIPRDKVRSIVSKEILQRGWNKLPLFLRKVYNPQYFIHEVFDILSSRSLVPSDIFVGGSSAALHSLKRARAIGMATVLERGSSHILYQDQLLEEEYKNYGAHLSRIDRPHPKIIEKELQEYELTDYISVPSSYAKRTYIERGIPERKLIQIPYGVDLSAFKQIPKEDSVFRVVFAGGMSLQKGVHYLLRAFAELKLPNSELMLIGAMNDEIKPFFKKYEGSYSYIGHVPQRDLYRYYSQGSVFAIASIQEGLALVQPQAMACGLPIIATTNTGAEDIIREGKDGFIIPIRDAAALKEKILFMYKHPDICRTMGQSAKERVSRGFTWDDYGDKMIAEYERILEERKTS